MPIVSKSFEEMRSEARRFLRDNSRLTNFSGDSLAWNLAEIPLAQLSLFWQSLSEADGQRFLHSATGESLTNLGMMFGLSRKTFQPAHTFNQVAGFKFLVPGGQTFSEIGGPGTATITAGTLVWASRDPRKIYRTTSDAVFTATTREVSVPILAEGSGVTYNVGPGQIDKHDAINLAAFIECTNLHPIDSGTDLEDDEAFRYRLSQQIYRLQGPSAVGIQAAAMNVPGVRDVIPWEYSRGTGTVNLTVLTYLPQTSTEVIARVQEEVEKVRPMGISVQIGGPVERAVNISIQIMPILSELIRTDVRQAVSTYLNLLTLGESLIINEIRQRVMEVSTDITDMNITSLSVMERYGQMVPSVRENQDADPDEKFYAGTVTIT